MVGLLSFQPVLFLSFSSFFFLYSRQLRTQMLSRNLLLSVEKREPCSAVSSASIKALVCGPIPNPLRTCQTVLAPIRRPQFFVRAKGSWLVARNTPTSALFNMCSMNITIHSAFLECIPPALGCLCSRRCRPILALDARASPLSCQ